MRGGAARRPLATGLAAGAVAGLAAWLAAGGLLAAGTGSGTAIDPVPAAPAGGAAGDPPDPDCPAPGAGWSTAVPWAQQRLDAAAAWRWSRGAGVTVAVVDSGIGANPQLAGTVVAGRDLVGDGRGPFVDCDGHGTQVAGIIAARPVRYSGFAGVAPAARLISIRCFATAREPVPITRVAAAIRLAADLGADVINVSAQAATDPPVLAAAVRYALAHGSVVVVAVGNATSDGTPASRFPVTDPGVIAVSAIDRHGALAGISGSGVAVDVLAPGVDIVSDAVPTGNSGVAAGHGDGTSFAAPFVSGSVALVLAAHPGLTPAQVERRIERTADRLSPTVPDAVLGWGVVDPVRAVTAALPAEPTPLSTQARPTRRSDPAGATLPGPGRAPSPGRAVTGVTRAQGGHRHRAGP